ncbi:MAG: hypothetical protein GY786_24855 [Proteobacteria bacterium]|nr:hypothetical protein [Pseudomonadota bacterium]
MDSIVLAKDKKFDEDSAWNLIRDSHSITTARGKKVDHWDPQKDDKSAIMKKVMGPSGNLRAPTFRIKNEFYVGFNPELYEKHLR